MYDSFATPWTVIARQAPLSTGFPKQEYWSEFAISFSRESSPPIEPHLLHGQEDSLPLSHQGSPFKNIYYKK